MNRGRILFPTAVALFLCAPSHVRAEGIIVTLTGSTAYRSVVYAACTTPGVVFASAASGAVTDPRVVSPLNTNSANDIVYEGYIKLDNGVYRLYDLVCSFTGSEAGIGSVAGVTNIPNDTPVFNGGTSPLPGVPPAYLSQSSGWTAKGPPGAITTDLALSDTSQAVSLTKRVVNTSTDLVPYGVVGIVTFEWLKGKNTAPSSSWTDLVNLTHPHIRFLLTSSQPASFFTGVQEDKTIVIAIGRNRGSGTRANCLLDAVYNVTTPVDQWAD